MVGSAGSGRLLNRVGARSLLLAGFALLGAGYGASGITAYGLPFFLAASVPVGLGLGIIVGGALRSIAIDEAPVRLRATAQGLINICNAIGTLSSAAAISAIADFRGGGASGFTMAYVVVTIVMLAMLAVTLRLRRDTPLGASGGFAEEQR
jgi:MFS family permease